MKKLPFLLVSLLFLLWGVANNMNDTLLAAFKRIMSMSDVQTSFVQFAFFGAYFCFAIPSAMFIRRYSYKSGILLGLLLYATGTMLFFPAGEAASYGFYLFAIYVMAGGCAILETTANPYILSMGPQDSATRRLNIAQSLNPVGAICGILLSRHFILSELKNIDAAERLNMTTEALVSIQRHELGAVSGTYMFLGAVLLLLLIVIACVRMPEDKDCSEITGIRVTFMRLWRCVRYRRGVVAQFFYVGVQTCVWSFTIRLSMERLGIVEKDASIVFLYSIIAFTLFRFFFTWLMGYVQPVKLLFVSCIGAVVCTSVVVWDDGWVSIGALIGISAFMSLMFPTIYGIALEDIKGPVMKIAASGLIMAIVGGAVLTPVQALVSDVLGIGMSFIVPLGCFLVILIYSLSVIIENNVTGK